MMKKIIIALLLCLLLPSTALATEYIGMRGINDNNNNMRIFDDRIHAIGFKAEQSAYITHVFVVYQAATGCASGYSCGDCGDMRVRILPSAGGTPPTPNLSGTVYSSGTHSFSCTDGECAPPETCRLIRHTMTTYYEVDIGTQYFIVIDNVDPVDPTVNYISTNQFTACETYNEPPVIGLDGIYDWFVSYTTNGGSSWVDHTNDLCESSLCRGGNAEITYSNGKYQGYVSYEPGNWGSYPFTVGQSGYFREQFQIQQTQEIRGARLMACAEGPSTLNVAFQKNGVTQVTGTITETSDTCSTCGANASTTMDWHTVALNSNDYFSVAEGDTVEILLTQASSTAWKITGGDRTGKDTFGSDVKEAHYPYSSAQRYYSGAWRNVSYDQQTCTSCEFARGHFRVNLQVHVASTTQSTSGTSGFSTIGGF